MDVKAVEEALLSEPYIAGVDISRQYPNTVVLEITERRPSGAILQNGKYGLVDQEGMILESVEAIPPGLVEIKDLQLPLLLPGTEISGIDFASVTSMLGSLPPALREKTAAVGLRAEEGLYLEAGGTLVIYGEANDLSRKNTIALMALSTLVERYGTIEYIDVSFPDHPVIKPAGAG
jgi:cell division protein FtsQ